MSTVIDAAPEPFWQRIPSIILYPLRGAALVTLVMLALVAIFRVLPFIGWLLSIGMWIGAYKYAFEILRRTADGDMSAPEVVLSVDSGVVWRFLALQLVLGVCLGVIALVGGPTMFIVGLLVFVFMQPAFTMTLAMTGSLGESLNPATAFSIVGRIGWPYLAVVGLLFVMQASAFTAGAWLSAVMPAFVANFIATMFGFWGLFSAFHLMGYLIYQEHEALGYEPMSTGTGSLAERAAASVNDAVIAQAEPLIREGRMADAIALLRAEVRSRAVSNEVHDLYRRLLQKAGDPAAVQEHARQYLHQLMMEKQDRRALGVLRETLDDDPAFVPLDPEHGVRLSEQARLGGQPQLSADMLHALFNAHPNDARSAQWGLTAAMLLIERNRNVEAKILLERARTRTTDAVLLQKIDGASTLV